MKVLLQRVTQASVRVGDQQVAAIGRGLLVLLGVEQGDGDRELDYFAAKTAELRIFPDDRHAMNRSLEDVGGELLVVSQFTLAAATRRGRRPSFSRAASPEAAEETYLRFCDRLRRRGLRVETGRFGAMMDVSLVNHGPVTVLLEPPSGEED